MRMKVMSLYPGWTILTSMSDYEMVGNGNNIKIALEAWNAHETLWYPQKTLILSVLPTKSFRNEIIAKKAQLFVVSLNKIIMVWTEISSFKAWINKMS